MKKIITLLVLLVSLQAFATEKHALIIAIGNYPSKGGWSSISSTNDVPLIKNDLLAHGFLDSNITTLIDSEATKKGIEQAMADLEKKIKKGDIVVIHYSG